MQGTDTSTRNFIQFTIIAISLLLLAYVYVTAFSIGWRMVAVVHAAVFFFLGCAVFMRNLSSVFLFALICCIPLQYGYHVSYHPLVGVESRPFSSGIRIDVTDVFLGLLYVRWLFLAGLRGEKRFPVTIGGTIGAILLLWIGYLLFAALLKSTNPQYSIYEVVELFKAFLLFFYLVNNVQTERDLKIVVYALFSVTVAHALYICFQTVTGINYDLHGVASTHNVELEGFRPAGFFGSWDASAILISMVLPVGLAFFIIKRDSPHRWLGLAGLIVVVIALLFTKVRATWLAVCVSTLMVLWLTSFRQRISARSVGKAIAAALAILILASPFIGRRLLSGTYGEDRLPLIYTAVNMIKDNWLLGVGLNNYFFHIDQYMPLSSGEEWRYTVHNEYLLWLAETGIFGFLLYYLLLLLAIARLWRTTQSTNPWIFAVSVGFCAALVASLPNRVLTFYHFLNTFLMYSVVLALTYCAKRLDDASAEEAEPSPKIALNEEDSGRKRPRTSL